MKSIFTILAWSGIPLFGLFFSWRLYMIPSRAETALFVALLFMIPSFIFPKLAFYYLLIIPSFIPMFRRLYYLLLDRPELDYIMLVTDGVLASMFIAIIMLWVKNKESNRDKLSMLILTLFFYMFLKIFLLQRTTTIIALYSFKYYGVYILFYFAGNYLVNNTVEFKKTMVVLSGVFMAAALYSIKQVYIGYFNFEKIWVESVNFTTLFIEGHIRTFSTLVSPAALADAMSLAMIVGMYFMFNKNVSAKIWGILLTVICTFPLLFATVRTNWIASAFSIWLFIYCYSQFKKISTIINVIVLPAFIIAIITFSDGSAESNTITAQKNLTGNTSSATDVMISNRVSALTNPLEEYSLQKRLATWQMIMNDTKHKYPMGSGLGTASYAHSLYFQLLGETGYLGIGIFLSILFIIGRRGIILLRALKKHDEILLISGFFTIFITVCILNLTGNHLNSHPLDIVFWFSCGGISHYYSKYFIHKTELIDEDSSKKPVLVDPNLRNA